MIFFSHFHPPDAPRVHKAGTLKERRSPRNVGDLNPDPRLLLDEVERRPGYPQRHHWTSLMLLRSNPCSRFQHLAGRLVPEEVEAVGAADLILMVLE